MSRGVTLPELIVAVALSLALAAMAVPAVGTLLQRHNAYVLNQALLTSLNLARTQAVTRRRIVAVCRSSRGMACDTDASWDKGWLVFEAPDNALECSDPHRTGYCREHGGQILHVEQRDTPGRVRMTHNHNVSRRVRFNTLGLSPGYTGRFTVCTVDGTPLRGLVVPQTGRIRVARTSELLDCNDG